MILGSNITSKKAVEMISKVLKLAHVSRISKNSDRDLEAGKALKISCRLEVKSLRFHRLSSENSKNKH